MTALAGGCTHEPPNPWPHLYSPRWVGQTNTVSPVRPYCELHPRLTLLHSFLAALATHTPPPLPLLLLLLLMMMMMWTCLLAPIHAVGLLTWLRSLKHFFLLEQVSCHARAYTHRHPYLCCASARKPICACTGRATCILCVCECVCVCAHRKAKASMHSRAAYMPAPVRA